MRIVEIFKGSKKEEMYLFVDQRDGLRNVPENLLAEFGNVESVMILPLHEDKKFARISAKKALNSIETRGFFVQMPSTCGSLVEMQITSMLNAKAELNNTQN